MKGGSRCGVRERQCNVKTSYMSVCHSLCLFLPLSHSLSLCVCVCEREKIEEREATKSILCKSILMDLRAHTYTSMHAYKQIDTY